MGINLNKSIYILKRNDISNVNIVKDWYMTGDDKIEFEFNIINQSLIKFFKENHRFVDFYINVEGIELWKLQISSADYTNPKLIKIDGGVGNNIKNKYEVDKLLLKAQEQERERQISKLLD